jgi:flagellar hook-associated protein 2
MSDREIELWEEKARSGMLRGDQLLSSIYNNIRAVTMARVEGLSGPYNNLSSIGITTGHYTERGKLHIDETRLREALTNDPEGVMNLFTHSGESAGQSGVAVKLYDAVNNAMSRITDKAGSNSALFDNSVLGRDIARLNQSISLAEERLLKLEERYYRQFTALEQAINRMNQQSMWLTQMLFSGQTG